MHAGVNQKRRQLYGLSMPGVGQKYNELVSSDTGGDPAFRNAGTHDVGQLNQYTVAGQMAQRIVDGLKLSTSITRRAAEPSARDRALSIKELSAA